MTTHKNDKPHKCQFTLFGKPLEHCCKCGDENPLITIWRQLVVHAIENKLDAPCHPYLKQPKMLINKQIMTMREYKRAMRSKNF
jgi:hypothetical protein